MSRSRRALHGLALVTLAATGFLVFAGGMVTSTGSGLAVPDWPLSFGTLNPPMVGGVFYEHGHRLIAGTVALLTALLALTAWRVEPRRGVRLLAWTALGLVLLQAALGGLTVLLLLPVAVSVAHAGVANLFFALLVALALVTARTRVEQSEPPAPVAPGLRRGWLALVALVYLQMLAGAIMRHGGAGLAIPDFPLALGQLVPPLDTWPVAIHFVHRIGAAALLALALPLLALTLSGRLRHPRLTAPAVALSMLLPLQAALGAFTIWTAKAPVVTSLHVVTGTLCLGAAAWGALQASRGPRLEARRSPAAVAAGLAGNREPA